MGRFKGGMRCMLEQKDEFWMDSLSICIALGAIQSSGTIITFWLNKIFFHLINLLSFLRWFSIFVKSQSLLSAGTA